MSLRLRLTLVAAVAVAVGLALLVAGCGGSDEGSGSGTGRAGTPPPLRLGTKNFPEQFLLGQLYKQALEAQADQHPHVLVVVDDEQPPPAPFAHRARGSANEKTLPSPGRLTTQIRPPCWCTIRWQMASPMPVPG